MTATASNATPTPTAEVESEAAPSVWLRFRSSRAGMVGLVALGALALVAIAAPLVTADSPISQEYGALLPPSFDHVFGTDELGRDLFARVIFGSRVSLETAAGAALMAAAVGVPTGLLGGYFGGLLDAVEMRIIDFILAVPGIVFALVVIAVLGSGEINTLLAIAVVSVPAFARLARASTLAVREREYVLAARAMGAGDSDIMFRTILPNIMAPIVVQLIVTASVAILIAAALSFLGLGTPPPFPTWGGMLQTSRSYLYQAPWYGIFPGFALAITIGAFDGVGRGLQVAFGSTGVLESKSGGFA